jgi:hypothetical protein
LCEHKYFQTPAKKVDRFSQVNPLVAAFYDTVLMYAWAFNKTLADGEDPTDGRILSRKLWNQTFYNGILVFVYYEEKYNALVI